jgi:PEP-CTERM motif
MHMVSPRRLVIALMIVCNLAGASRTVGADPVSILDQSFLGGLGGVSGNDPFSQTFTVGTRGTLSRVAVNIFGEADVTLDIRRTTSLGVPLLSDAPADQLGRVTISPPPFGLDLVNADLDPFNISVAPGELLAIVLRSPGIQNWGVAHNQDATYARGQAFLRLNGDWKTFGQAFPTIPRGDFQFQTFVQPIPEPSTLTLMGIGLAYGWRQRSRFRIPRRDANRAAS